MRGVMSVRVVNARVMNVSLCAECNMCTVLSVCTCVRVCMMTNRVVSVSVVSDCALSVCV